jgi:gamma-glutamyltranspeptidase
MGYHLAEHRGLVNINAVMRVPDGWTGVSEPRSTGGVAGY